uniref:Uncharacterized protein n=1 Tax=Anguilla anguilla TaxID=7936 RepID=A0A0E9UU63_ANGAN
MVALYLLGTFRTFAFGVIASAVSIDITVSEHLLVQIDNQR